MQHEIKQNVYLYTCNRWADFCQRLRYFRLSTEYDLQKPFLPIRSV